MPLVATKRKKSVHHRKRQAHHHRQSKPYLKTYWPYLPMLLIVGAGFMVNNLWAASEVLGAKSDFSSTSLLSDTNAIRTSDHEQPLSVDAQLTAAAQAKADDMAAHNYWAHTSPDGKTPWTFIGAAGYQYQAAGENLAYGFPSASDVVTGWMNSPEHRANVLNANYQNVGFGVAHPSNYQGKGPETIVVAEYGQPVDAAANISFSVANPAPIDDSAVKGASHELSAKPVSRVQLLTQGRASWSLALVSALFGAALAVFIVRHSLRLHRAISRGEAFVAHHPYFDIAIVFVITIGFILTRTTGLIR